MNRYWLYLMNGQRKSMEADEFQCVDGWIVFYKIKREIETSEPIRVELSRWNGGTIMTVETTQEEEKSDSKIITLG